MTVKLRKDGWPRGVSWVAGLYGLELKVYPNTKPDAASLMQHENWVLLDIEQARIARDWLDAFVKRAEEGR